MELVPFYIFIAFCAYVTYKNRRKAFIGGIKTKSGEAYEFSFGNYLKSDTASFHGLDVRLPYSLANFYLDSHIDSKLRGPAALYDSSQVVSLEGDFNKYFRLFVPQASAVLVLSILSPEVMQTLKTSAKKFDVELYNDHLRIISNEKVDINTAQANFIVVAEAIIKELDERAKSWQKTNEQPTKLIFRRGITFKLANLYVRRSRVITSVLTILFMIVIIGLGMAFYYNELEPNFNDPFSKGTFAGTMMYAAEYIIVATIIILMLGPIVWLLTRRFKDKEFPRF